MDVIKHGESAYPVTAWAEYQYSKTSKIKSMIGNVLSADSCLKLKLYTPFWDTQTIPLLFFPMAMDPVLY